jgi:hypothetical protein
MATDLPLAQSFPRILFISSLFPSGEIVWFALLQRESEVSISHAPVTSRQPRSFTVGSEET